MSHRLPNVEKECWESVCQLRNGGATAIAG